MHTLFSRFRALAFWDQLIIIMAVSFAGFVLVDPFFVRLTRDVDPAAHNFLREFTHLGRSGWILVPAGLIYLAGHIIYHADPFSQTNEERAYNRRWRVATAHLANIAGYVFIAVGGAGLTASLLKNTIGRARPKYFDTLGPVEFTPFAFKADFASFPSGHSTTILAFAVAIGFLFPKARIAAFAIALWVAASRFFIGAHYFTDVAAGVALGITFVTVLTLKMAERKRTFFVQQIGDGETRCGLRGAKVLRWAGARILAGLRLPYWLRGERKKPDAPSQNSPREEGAHFSADQSSEK